MAVWLLLTPLAGAEPAAQPNPWTSVVTGGPVDTHWTPASSSTLAGTPAATAPVVIYLQGLAVPRVGTVPDATLLAEFTAAGFHVLQLDYRGDPRSVLPGSSMTS